MSVAREAKKAVENVYGTVYTVGCASNILCEFSSSAACIVCPFSIALCFQGEGDY